MLLAARIALGLREGDKSGHMCRACMPGQRAPQLIAAGLAW